MSTWRRKKHGMRVFFERRLNLYYRGLITTYMKHWVGKAISPRQTDRKGLADARYDAVWPGRYHSRVTRATRSCMLFNPF